MTIVMEWQYVISGRICLGSLILPFSSRRPNSLVTGPRLHLATIPTSFHCHKRRQDMQNDRPIPEAITKGTEGGERDGQPRTTC